MDNLQKDIEKQKIDIARILKPHMATQQVIDADTGQLHDQKRISQNVIMTGTTQQFTMGGKMSFTRPGSVHISLNPESTVSMYARMISGNKFEITAASALSNVKIKVLMRGY